MARVECRSPGRKEYRSLGNEIRCNRLVDGIRERESANGPSGGRARQLAEHSGERPRRRAFERAIAPERGPGNGGVTEGSQSADWRGSRRSADRRSPGELEAFGERACFGRKRDANAAAPAPSLTTRSGRAASLGMSASLGRVAVPRQCFGADGRRPSSQTVTRPRAGSSVSFGWGRAGVGRRNVRGAAAAVTQCCAVGEEILRGVLASHGAARVSSRRRWSVDGAFGSHRAGSDARDTAQGRLSPRGDGRTGSASHRPRRSVPIDSARHRHPVVFRPDAMSNGKRTAQRQPRLRTELVAEWSAGVKCDEPQEGDRDATSPERDARLTSPRHGLGHAARIRPRAWLARRRSATGRCLRAARCGSEGGLWTFGVTGSQAPVFGRWCQASARQVSSWSKPARW